MLIEKTTFNCMLSDLQYDYDGACTKEMKGPDALKTERISVEEGRLHAELFRSKARLIIVNLRLTFVGALLHSYYHWGIPSKCW